LGEHLSYVANVDRVPRTDADVNAIVAEFDNFLTESLDGEIRKEFGIEDEYHLAFLSTESFVIANHPINIFDSLPIARKIAVLRTTVLPYFTVEIPMFMR
jgi:hypothetical protein